MGVFSVQAKKSGVAGVPDANIRESRRLILQLLNADPRAG
jgi:hypothetical protein